MATPRETLNQHSKESRDHPEHALLAGEWVAVSSGPSGTVSPPTGVLSPTNNDSTGLAGDWAVVSGSGMSSPTGILSPTGMGSPTGSRSHSPMPMASGAAGVAASAAPAPANTQVAIVTAAPASIAVKPDAPTAAAVVSASAIAVPAASSATMAVATIAAAASNTETKFNADTGKPAAPLTTMYDTTAAKSPSVKSPPVDDYYSKQAELAEERKKREEHDKLVSGCIPPFENYDINQMLSPYGGPAWAPHYYPEAIARLLQFQAKMTPNSDFYRRVQTIAPTLTFPKSFSKHRENFYNTITRLKKFFSHSDFYNPPKSSAHLDCRDYVAKPGEVLSRSARVFFYSGDSCGSALYDYYHRIIPQYPSNRCLIHFLDDLAASYEDFWKRLIVPRLGTGDPEPLPEEPRRGFFGV